MSSVPVDIVVPCYNGERHLAACLDSIVAQSHPHWRCTVVDDGSTDGSAALVDQRRDPRIRLLRQANAGVSAARNRGLAEAGADYLMFLDGDDVLHPTALARLSAALDGDGGVVAAFGGFTKILPDGRAYPGQKPTAQQRYPSGDVLEPMLRGNFLANGGHVLIRTGEARAIGGFDPELRLSEDWEFWCRLAARGPFAFVGADPEIMSLRVDPGSSSGGLSVEWANHAASLAVVAANPAIRARFTQRRWARIVRAMRASAMWEAGRVNFTLRRHREARRLMIAALRLDPRPKRLALFAAALATRLTGRTYHSRLRFRDEDLVSAAHY